VIGKLARQVSDCDIPKANRQRRRINSAPTNQINAVRCPCEITLAVPENFVSERKSAEDTPIRDVPHFYRVQSVGARGKQRAIWRKGNREHVRTDVCADGSCMETRSVGDAP